MICFKIKILFKYRFGRIPVLCKICRFRSFFFVYLNYFENCWKCSLLTVISIKDIRFAVENHPQSLFAGFGHFFFVYLNYFENCWEMFNFNGYKHQGHSICSRKPPSKFLIGAFLRLITDTIKHFCETSSIITDMFFNKSYLNIDLVDSGFYVRLPFFAVHFFFVFSIIFETLDWEMFTFNGYKHQGHSIGSRKPPSKFVIGAFFRLVMLYKETKKKNFRNL
ncbi:hypothetical protein AGLY_018268 [Aphis glycines]|uniref:Uncharacterized protein n=1 Tax=Aphis glycines TaxID=307491 RepID=A0A6G0STN9_APHGL|nr:hypothetical protein AGLY_018268 [Aphis glycines]